MRFTVEAYDKNGAIVENRDNGQIILNCQKPLATRWVRQLKSGRDRPQWANVQFWTVADSRYREIARIENPHFIAFPNYP